jgi:hypothetical protein
MLKAMRRHYKARRFDAAAAIARDAAPYCHPRLATAQLNTSVGVLLEIVEEIVDAPGPLEG